jgi:hypothetical protein
MPRRGGWIAGWTGVLLICAAGAALAGQPQTSEERLLTASQRIERAVVALGEQTGGDRLAAGFRVAPRLVADLRDQKLDFGEIALLLALAEMGHTPPDTILGWWASRRLTWVEIADRLRVDPPALQKRLETLRRHLGRSAP